VAGVMLAREVVPDLLLSGLRDSKRIPPDDIPELADSILKCASASHVETLEPVEINAKAPPSEQARFIGEWLASAHTRTVANLLQLVPRGKKPVVRMGLSSRRFFAQQVLTSPWAPNVELDWRPRAEAWPEVAAAAVLAKRETLDWYSRMEREGFPGLTSKGLDEVARLADVKRVAKLDFLAKAQEQSKAFGFFAIREFAPDDREQIDWILVNVLQRYYPTISTWARGKDGLSGSWG